MQININEIPDHEADRLVRSLLAAAEKFYADPANMAEFLEWQRQRRERLASKNGTN